MIALTLAALVAATPAEQTAKIDVDRYLGTWYELARFDHRYERGCVGVTATYKKRDDGKLDVTNRCVKDDLKGEVKSVHGKAWAPDPADPGKLKVQFFWPFRGDYWVLEVAPDYSWAVVGEPGKSSAWILSRTPTVPDALYDSLVGKLKARGYDTSKLLRVPQNPEEAVR